MLLNEFPCKGEIVISNSFKLIVKVLPGIHINRLLLCIATFRHVNIQMYE
jgi:hypothetical protein